MSVQAKKLLKLPKEMPSNIVSLTFYCAGDQDGAG